MVENLRKAEFDAAQPVRNKETGKIATCIPVGKGNSETTLLMKSSRKAEFDAAQPVRNKETGKIDYIVRVADHKTAESAPGVIAPYSSASR
jgi:hypothetical protein